MPIRIALADDHAVLRSGLEALISNEAGMKVVAEAGTGPEAVEVALDPGVDLLVLDIRMPQLSGVAVAERVLDRRPELPIVVLTMFDDEYYLRQLMKVGARAFVLKESVGSDLLHAIRAAYEGKRYIDPTLADRVITPFLGQAPRTTPRRIDRISQREREVCRLLAYGLTNREIASELEISVRTVETHRTNLSRKLELGSRAELVRFAIESGLMVIE